METSNDRRRAEGSPGELPVSKNPVPLDRAFSTYSVPKLLAWVLGIIGAALAVLGAITSQIPLMVVGVAVLIAAALAYFAGQRVAS